ncbi:hypothetical protein BJX63DRAFT_427678 [Aspergillus granulosus]|uniref:Uncharacterized protein n=1 Tax=Aspergillus granulosus TaxID=176169 RepID=A0ABR4I3W7_9EURO
MADIKRKVQVHVGKFVDDLTFVINALLANDDPADRIRDILRVWEHYSQILKPHPVYLDLFQDWLVRIIDQQDGMAEAINIIRPPSPSLHVRPTVSSVPTGPGIIEWDPHEGDYPHPSETAVNEEKEEPDGIQCTILNCHMQAGIPSEAHLVYTDREPHPTPRHLSIWSAEFCSPTADTENPSHRIQNSVILAALLFLDTYTKTPGILQTMFPSDADFPHFAPVNLEDKFIAFIRQRARDAPEKGWAYRYALRRLVKGIPAQILRDLIWSFLDTLEADPSASNYSTLQFRTFDLIEILLHTDKPQLATDIVVQAWKDFANSLPCIRK